MLQQEEMRARKKIEETKKKTRDILTLQEKNDSVYQRRMHEEARQREMQEREKRIQLERRFKQQNDIKARGREMNHNKEHQVMEVRMSKQQAKQQQEQ